MAKESACTIRCLRLSTRFQNVIWPLNVVGFAKALVKKGYRLAFEIPPPNSLTIPRLGFSGNFAYKEGTTVDLNSDRQFIGVSETDPGVLVERFSEVTDLLTNIEALGGPLRPWFTEFQGSLELEPEKSPLEILKKGMDKSKLKESIGEVLGLDVCVSNIRITADYEGLDSTDYFDIYLEPAFGRRTRVFDVLIVRRNHDSKVIIEFVSNFEKTIDKLTENLSAI